MFKTKRRSYKFSDKRHPVKALVSVALMVIAFAAIISLSFWSSGTEGNGGLLIGGIGLAAMIVSLVGFILGIQSLKQKEIIYLFPIMGTLMNGFLLIAYFIIYIIGLCI